MKIKFNKKIEQWWKCSYITSLRLELENNFNKNEENKIINLIEKFNIKKDKNKLIQIQWKWINKQFVRVIIPKEAKILNKNVSVTYYRKRWKSVSFYMNTKVWNKSNFIIRYILPNIECKSYNYMHYKQPWINDFDLNIEKIWNNIEFLNNKKDVFYD